MDETANLGQEHAKSRITRHPVFPVPVAPSNESPASGASSSRLDGSTIQTRRSKAVGLRRQSGSLETGARRVRQWRGLTYELSASIESCQLSLAPGSVSFGIQSATLPETERSTAARRRRTTNLSWLLWRIDERILKNTAARSM